MSETVIIISFERRTYRQLPKWWPLREGDVYGFQGLVKKIEWPRSMGTDKASDNNYYRDYAIEDSVKRIEFNGQMMRRMVVGEKIDWSGIHIEGDAVSYVDYDYCPANLAGSLWTGSSVLTKEAVREVVADNPIPCSTCGRDIRIAKNLLLCRRHYISAIAELEAEVAQLRLRVPNG